jgi:hypothetical protein
MRLASGVGDLQRGEKWVIYQCYCYRYSCLHQIYEHGLHCILCLVCLCIHPHSQLFLRYCLPVAQKALAACFGPSFATPTQLLLQSRTPLSFLSYLHGPTAVLPCTILAIIDSYPYHWLMDLRLRCLVPISAMPLTPSPFWISLFHLPFMSRP